MVKSPSDTTIYAPALQRKLTPTGKFISLNGKAVNNVTLEVVGEQPQTTQHSMFNTVDLNQINEFVEAVHSEQHPEDDTRRRESTDLEQARNRAERAVVDAEKFRAMVEQPAEGTSRFRPQNLLNNQMHSAMINSQGDRANMNGLVNVDSLANQVPNAMRIMDIGSGVHDDDFFHLTCHIEPSLIHKIENGEFIELEKLLPKEKLGRADESHLEWVQRDGGTFLVPAQKDNKIGSFMRWEQAFRAYATIYCGAHPHRSKEIWQYITVINTVASSYIWDNVYNYDITFHHLMAFNPQRSWAVTYNQMWNLSMRDPLPKNFAKPAQAHYAGGFVNFRSNSNQNQYQTERNKSDYCWNFNKGVPCKFGPKCKFIERCKYCDSPSHGVNSCFKLQKKEGNKNVGSANVANAGDNKTQK